MESDCERFRRQASSYWLTPPEARGVTFRGLEEHVMKCDSCAEYLEDLASGKD